MNLIIRDGSVDRYATNEDFRELESIINEDLGKTLIYLGYCEGEKDDLIKTIEKIRNNLSTRYNMSEDLEIALVDDYVVFNIIDKSKNPLGITIDTDELPKIVIMKRDMRSIYFLREIEYLNIFTENEKYLSKIQVSYEATLYTYANQQVKKSQTEFDTFIKEELEEPFFETNQFMSSLDKALSKIIIFNNSENK